MSDYRIFVYVRQSFLPDTYIATIMESQKNALLALLKPSERKRIYFK
jgi:hypothetical protein